VPFAHSSLKQHPFARATHSPFGSSLAAAAHDTARRVMPTEDTMNARFLVLGLTLAATSVAGASQSLAIKVSPAVSFAPANLVIRTSVDPDAGNRALEVVAESEDFYRASTVTLDGDHAPKTAQFEFRSLPPGEYEISVVVTGADGRRRAISRGQAKVVESGAAR
jgi:hypothetical protein